MGHRQRQQIVAIGGGGLSTEPEDARLRDFILGLTGRPEPRVCFVPTASGDAETSLLRFYLAFATRPCRPAHLSLFQRTVDDPRAFLLDQDVIFVGGGNTANMLAVWRLHGVDAALREAWQAGIVLGGVSAGSLCWFEGGITDSFGPQLAPLRDGLGLLPGTNCPHYDGEPARRPAYHRYVAEGLPGGLAADDGCALHFVGTELAEAVALRPGAQAYRVAQTPTGVTETAIPARLLT
jgi:dipeptidase E